MESKSFTLDEIESVAQWVIDNVKDCSVVLFDGEMGAGKTTMIKTVSELMGTEDLPSSPTFSIVNDYKLKDGRHVYHFDFYRLEDELEAMNIGVEDYFYSGHYCFIEWASRVENILPDEYILVSLEVEDEKRRKISITHGR